MTNLDDKTLVSVIMGQSPPGETYNKNKIGLPFYQGKADFGNIRPVPSVWCSSPKKIAECGDILLSVRAPVGPTNIATEKCCVGRGLAAIRCKDGLSHKYLIWVLRHFERIISSGGVGSTFSEIGKDEIARIEFPLPPTIDEQIRISNQLEQKLAEIEKMRQAALRRKEAINAILGALLKEAFPWKEGDRLPDGWRWVKIGGKSGVAEIVNGSTPSTDEPLFWNGDILWATPTDLGNLRTIYIGATKRKITQAGLDSCSTKLLPIGTVLLTSRAPIGNLAITSKFMCTNQGFKSFIPKDGVNSLYIYFALKYYMPDIIRDSHLNTFAEITKGAMQNFEIPLPSTIDEQILISNQLEQKLHEIEIMHNSIKREVEAIEALPSAILREVFDFESSNERNL